jgi:hypothetical protein
MRTVDKLAALILICIMGALACSVEVGFTPMTGTLAVAFIAGAAIWLYLD